MAKVSADRLVEKRKRVAISVTPEAEPELYEWLSNKERPATYLKGLAIMDMARNRKRIC